ncbi:DMT family transporter [Bacillus sp. FJAT-45350]|uniref:DMT family transporter n=1 Tax=Bacillus sp. FJAT-45350 TaxID=2011014 RepID=UPI000BB73270|nr:DMT family transporter [Bacillus sp. FJAT-45350]
MNRGLIYFIISMAFIGISIVIGDGAMEKFPVWLFTFATLAVAVVLLVPLASFYEKTKWFKLGKRNYYGIFMQSLLTCTLYTVFMMYGLTYANAISVGIITSITPAVVLVLAYFLLKERLNARKLVAIGLAIIAVLIMNIAGVNPGGDSSFLGTVFMLLAVVSLSLFFIYAKKFAVELQPLTLAAGLCVMGLLMTLPMAIYEFAAFDMAVVTAGDWWVTFFYGLTGWALAYSFTFLGIPKINASTAGMATAVIPIVATVVAVLFYGAPLRMVDMIALLLVIASIFIAESQEREEVSLDLSTVAASQIASDTVETK